MHRTFKQSQSGFGLVEALVALVVVSVGMIGIAVLYGQGLGASRTALYRTQAVILASDMADRIRLNRRAGNAYKAVAAGLHRQRHVAGSRARRDQLSARDPRSGPLRDSTRMNRRQQNGMTLIELMVALAIGTFLMLGAVTVFMQSRTSFRVTESLSRLQENARFALDTMEPEIRMAHFWGLTARTYLIQGRAAPAAGAGVGVHDCGHNWKLNLNETVEGSNTYANVIGCAPAAPGAQVPNSDVLVVRRAGEDAIALAALTAGTLYIQSTRAQLGQIFAGTAIPAGYDPATSETHRLLASGYFVSTTSSITGMPSLRRKFVQANGTIGEEEIMVGVEDMQIQFGIDTDVPGTPV